MNLINIFLSSILTDNIILTKFLGICPFIGTSNKEKDALNMGASVTIVLTLSSIITYFLYHYLLVPTKTEYLETIIFILVIASLVQLLIILLKKYSKKIIEHLGIYLPLITTNCAILGISLLSISNNYNLLETIVYALGSGIGFTLVIYIFATIREKMSLSDIPKSFKGVPIALIVAGIMAIIFSKYII